MSRNIYATGPHATMTPDGITLLTPPAGTKTIGYMVQTNGQLRYTIDGSNPSASFGFRLTLTDGVLLIPATGNIIKIISEVAGNVVNVVPVGGSWT